MSVHSIKKFILGRSNAAWVVCEKTPEDLTEAFKCTPRSDRLQLWRPPFEWVLLEFLKRMCSMDSIERKNKPHIFCLIRRDISQMIGKTTSCVTFYSRLVVYNWGCISTDIATRPSRPLQTDPRPFTVLHYMYMYLKYHISVVTGRL